MKKGRLKQVTCYNYQNNKKYIRSIYKYNRRGLITKSEWYIDNILLAFTKRKYFGNIFIDIDYENKVKSFGIINMQGEVVYFKGKELTEIMIYRDKKLVRQIVKAYDFDDEDIIYKYNRYGDPVRDIVNGETINRYSCRGDNTYLIEPVEYDGYTTICDKNRKVLSYSTTDPDSHEKETVTTKYDKYGNISRTTYININNEGKEFKKDYYYLNEYWR